MAFNLCDIFDYFCGRDFEIMLKFGKNIREVTGNEFYSNSLNRGDCL